MKKVLSVVCMVVLIGTFAQAKVLDADYSVSFGFLGKMGTSHAHYETNKEHYKISINAAATGMARMLSKNRIESHTSEGFVKNGRLYAKTYDVVITYGKKRKVKQYIFDYETKSITKTIQKYVGDKLVSQSSERLAFFGSDDLLTLYFNLPLLMSENTTPGDYRFKAAGAERQDGMVEVHVPEAKEIGAYEKILGKGEYRYLTAIIYQKIFNSNRGELMIAIGKDGVAQKAALKDLIMFGDLIGERVQ